MLYINYSVLKTMCTLSQKDYVSWFHNQRIDELFFKRKVCACGAGCHNNVTNTFKTGNIITTNNVVELWEPCNPFHKDGFDYSHYRHVKFGEPNIRQKQVKIGGGEEIFRYHEEIVSEPYQITIPGEVYEEEESYTVSTRGEPYTVRESYTEQVPYTETESYWDTENYTVMEAQYIGGSGYTNYTTHTNRSAGSFVAHRPVTKKRDVRKNRTVTKYRTVTKHRNVTKYYPDTYTTEYRTVIKSNPDQYETRYREITKTVPIPTGEFTPIEYQTVDIAWYQCDTECLGISVNRVKCNCPSCRNFVKYLTERLNENSERICLKCGKYCRQCFTFNERCDCRECACVDCIMDIQNVPSWNGEYLGSYHFKVAEWICTYLTSKNFKHGYFSIPQTKENIFTLLRNTFVGVPFYYKWLLICRNEGIYEIDDD